MKNRKTLLVVVLSTLFLAASAVVIGNRRISNFSSSRATSAKTVVDVTSTSIRLSNGYSVAAETSGFTDGSLFTLSENGYIRNTEPIRGITNITLTYDEGSAWAKIVPCFFSYEEDEVVETTGEWGDAVESKDFTSSPIDYFELFNADAEDVVIKSISITYSCSTSYYSFSASFTPDWNSKTADNPADIYIVGTQELVPNGTSQGGWYFTKMTYNAGTYSYTCPNSLPTGVYSYRFVAVENGQSYSWNPCTQDTTVIELNEDYTDSTNYAWSQEPGYVAAENFTLNLTINASGAPSSFGNMQFIYNTSNSTSEYVWPQESEYIATSWSSPFEFSKSGFDVSSTLYFKIYMWSDSMNIRVGGEAGANFSIIPSGAATENYTISFTYSASEAIVGTCTNDDSGEIPTSMSHANVTTKVYNTDNWDSSTSAGIVNGRTLISPTFDQGTDTLSSVTSSNSNNVRVDHIGSNYYLTALKAGTNATITLNSSRGLSTTFTAMVSGSTYSASRDTDWCGTGQAISTFEGWFSNTSISEISGMGADFFNGVDISATKALYENGSKFYNTSGTEQSVFYIFKDAGINWIRLKLWVNPYDTNGVSYGGGIGDLNSTLWMAYEAKAAGLKLLLDFHYSDYWTHPGQQVLPRDWGNPASASALATLIKNYTKETLNTFNSNDCLPDMVQLGNEISSGSFLKVAGSGTSFTSYEPDYVTKASSFTYAGSDTSNRNTYLNAGVEAVKEINSSLSSNIKTVVHWAKGGSISASIINNFFNGITADYDYAGISFYPYYCFDDMSAARSILKGLNITTDNDGWFIAETSYPFSGRGYVYENSTDVTSFTISKWIDQGDVKYTSGITNIYSSYDFTAAGQANLIHDLTSEVVDAGGLGIFYWEPAWIPNLNVGWAAAGSLNSWGNQGFFSFDGKAIANINVFAQMSPYIN